MIYILIAVFILTLLYYKLSKLYYYWNDRGVKHVRKSIVADLLKFLLKKESFFVGLINVYNKFPEARYVGMYQITFPMLLIRDPELIKRIFVKDFDHFMDHRDILPNGCEPLWAKNLFALKGLEWKQMRNTLTPSFTTSKMKLIFTLILETVNVYMEHFTKKTGIIEIELKDAMSRYTNDVIASVAFGIKCDSINVDDAEFHRMGKKITHFGAKESVNVMTYVFAPAVARLLDLRVFNAEAMEYLLNIIKENIEYREKNNIHRPDMISILMDERKHLGEKPKDQNNPIVDITDDDIAAQAFIFFFAGYDTVSTLLTFLGYELTINPDVQERLQDEIDEIYTENDGKLTYETLMRMRYMEMVISETLRLWSPALAGDRTCTKPYRIPAEKPWEKDIELNRGELVWVPTHALHRDPKYFPDPLKFDPERFADENKDKIPPYSYSPFGQGPRVCIGMRLAQMEVKAFIFYLLAKYSFVRTDRTEVPVKISSKSFDLKPADGIWVGLKKRD